jgi:hypothetical protein
MALSYQTEYRLGDRGLIRRSYTGFQALVAIGLDLVFGLAFELVGLTLVLMGRVMAWTARRVIRLLVLYWRFLVAVMTLVVSAVTLPFVMLHRGAERLRARDRGGPVREEPARSAVDKPSWAFAREL